MKNAMLAIVLILCAAVLCACGSGSQTPAAAPSSSSQEAVSGIPQNLVGEGSDAVDYDADFGDYDPAAEEDFGDVEDIYENPAANNATATATPPRVNVGATPLVIDPIDKPTPTPAPALAFNTFVTYDATKLRLSFQAPENWTIDDSLPDTYILTNPSTRVSYQAQLMITSKAVSTEYTTSDLNREVKSVLSAIRAEYSGFEPSNTAERTLFDKKGRYADFTGTLKGTDIKVWGRVHAVTVNKTLVVVRMTAPLEYRNVYKNTVYPKFRETVKFTR
ncbi:MAG: hypothetical protein IJK28_11355 [Clostridia bacterium]|nr:hypothetical protein [Clostridia bacterium]